MAAKEIFSKVNDVLQKPLTFRPKFYYKLFYVLEFLWVIFGCYWIFTTRSLLVCIAFLIIFAILHHMATLASRLMD